MPKKIAKRNGIRSAVPVFFAKQISLYESFFDVKMPEAGPKVDSHESFIHCDMYLHPNRGILIKSVTVPDRPFPSRRASW